MATISAKASRAKRSALEPTFIGETAPSMPGAWQVHPGLGLGKVIQIFSVAVACCLVSPLLPIFGLMYLAAMIQPEARD